MIEPSLGTTAVTYVPYIISVLVLIFFLFMYFFLVFSDIGNRGNRIEDVPSPKEKAGMRDCFARLGWKGYWQLSMLDPSAVKPL